MDNQTIEKLRSRVKRCRWLATQTDDARIAETLREIAEEAEGDIARALAESGHH